MTTISAPESLRARKQRETQAALHAAAIERVLSDGLENATVAAIAADVGVSARTFFNYFDSKEAAILGNHRGILDEAHVAEFLAGNTTGAGLLHDIAEFVHAAFLGDDEGSTVGPEKRREVVFRYPVLIHAKMENTDHMEREISAVVTRRLRAAKGIADEEADVEALMSTEEWGRARMLVHLGGVPLRYTARELSSGRYQPEEQYRRSLQIFDTILNEMT